MDGEQRLGIGDYVAQELMKKKMLNVELHHLVIFEAHLQQLLIEY